MMTGEEGFDFGDSCYVDNHFCYLLGYGGPEGWGAQKGSARCRVGSAHSGDRQREAATTSIYLGIQAGGREVGDVR